MSSTHTEEKPASVLEKGDSRHNQVERIATIDVDNYHGIDAKTILVYIVSETWLVHTFQNSYIPGNMHPVLHAIVSCCRIRRRKFNQAQGQTDRR